MTREEWNRFTRGSAMRRAGYAGLRRNVAVAVLVEALEDEESLVRRHVAWAVGRIDSPEAWDALSSSLPVEEHARVREELELALSR